MPTKPVFQGFPKAFPPPQKTPIQTQNRKIGKKQTLTSQTLTADKKRKPARYIRAVRGPFAEPPVRGDLGEGVNRTRENLKPEFGSYMEAE